MITGVVGCKKDESPSGSDEKEGVLYFRGFDEEQIIFYVGGEERSSSDFDFTKLFNETRQSWISESYYQDNTYFFDGDTLEIDVGEGLISRKAYLFSNDSVFTTEPDIITSIYYQSYIGMGTKTEIRNKQGLSYTRVYRANGTVKEGGGFEPSKYNTPESMIGRSEFQGIDQMGENDTLLLLNQRKLYN